VSALQALALNILNEGVSLTFEELSRKLSLEESILNPVMHSRSYGSYKVIAKSPTGNKINTTDTFTANSNFSCNMRKILITMASLDSLLNTKRVEKDQLIAIEAAIVIMKARKTLQHQQLHGEVLESGTTRSIKAGNLHGCFHRIMHQREPLLARNRLTFKCPLFKLLL
jgi:hypothetical protein